MSAADPNPTSLDPARLDLLVDGELSDEERRELLQQLDRVPGGWRSCAMAFLEAQCWKESLRPVPRKKEEVEAPAVRRPSRPSWRGPLATLVAMAASFLMALGLGAAIRATWYARHPGNLGGSELAAVAPREEPPKSPPTASPAPSQLAKDNPAPPRGWQPEAAPNKPVETVRVAIPGVNGQVAESVELPVTERDRLDESWLRPAPVPPEVRDMLERMGCKVEPSRHLLPAPLDDGRRLVVPVDEWQIRYVGNRGFQ